MAYHQDLYQGDLVLLLPLLIELRTYVVAEDE